MELLLGLVLSSIIFGVIAGIYNAQTMFFNKELSGFDLNSDARIILASFKRYTARGVSVVSCNSTALTINTIENNVVSNITWQVDGDNKRMYLYTSPGTYGYLLTDKLVAQPSYFSNSVAPSGIERVGVDFELKDKYGQRVKRHAVYRLILSGDEI